MKGFLYILTAYLLGEIFSLVIGGMIPGTILGMIVMFCALQFRVIKEDDVKGAAGALLKDMMLLFIPISVGLMVAMDAIGGNLWKIIVILVSTTILVIGLVGFIQQKLGNRK